MLRVVDPTNIDAAVIDAAAEIIRSGGLVAFPTETVYGLGADATNTEAVDRIFAAKGRPSFNPLIVHVATIDAARACVATWPRAAQLLAEKFWPGPLTLVLPKLPRIVDRVTARLPTVGIRIPAHPVALALLRASDRPIAAPSANLSMELSPTEGAHVDASLGDRADMILDAGPATIGIESTVLDLTSDMPIILRPGMIGRADIAAVIGETQMHDRDAAAGEARRSPGQLERHYSPRARVALTLAVGADGIDEAVLRESGTDPVAVLARSPYESPHVTVVRMPTDPAMYARDLYGTLHRLDRGGTRLVVVERVPDDAAWDGVRDRLRRM